MKFPLFIISVILVLGGIISFSYHYHQNSVFHYPIETETLNISSITAELASFQATSTGLHIPIFIYHSIRPYQPGESTEQDTYDITPELFEQQLSYMQAHTFTPISLDELTDMIHRGNTGAIKNPVVLTFDDGLQNQYEYAFPLLKKYGMYGTFYVFTHAMDVNPHFMTWNELKELSEAGMSIESHSITHPYLTKLNDSELHNELLTSKKTLEEHLGKPVNHFAAPFGTIDERISAEAKKDGYLTARAISGLAPLSPKNLFHLPGIIVSDSLNMFIKELSF